MENDEGKTNPNGEANGVLPATSETLTQPLFRPLSAANIEELETSELESLCLSCHENGVTRLLLTKIPMFRDIIVISFHCPHCGNSNNEIQENSPTQTDGVEYTVAINEPTDLNRLVVKANHALLKIPSLEFEIPPGTQKGSINTLEGFIQMSISELEQDQPARKEQYPEIAAKIDDFIKRLSSILKVETPFNIVIDDPSGNSFVESKTGVGIEGSTDDKLSVKRYKRSEEQDKQLGIIDTSTKGESSDNIPSAHTLETGGVESSTSIRDEVMSFGTECPNCQMPAETNMKLVDIPHFKEVVLMALNCDYCGHKSNEIKSGSGISDKGKKIELRITDPTDLSRDILKSETASMYIPELEFEVKPGTLGGRFSTIEGILTSIKEQLAGANPFVTGDASSGSKMAEFIKKLDEVIKGQKLNIHIILDDPAGNSYLQNLYAPDEDPEMKILEYDRTFEQNDDLGLNDIKTEDY
ncbi:PREDICTED: zinc finger protein ZPR1-like isoform X2 [Amphimedon queenslandica]|uniref:Zinc finger protein ZPR1 n=1 Tax=Amphimedon queenslandica TaxID=400682 RepID=A0AAN0IPV5_AMPQE|nr:PREDICTED: zinc finger protein ZPR1-like isoform X2 [Amphimedon queenslandica]|eukprot:XP_011406423.1 PREDICTED: zinc finger protein ZPR1-like isoform X2 [Amphimedon queenslandica]